MQDSEWGEAPKPKRRIPVWAWWTCGGGCLVALIAAAAVAFFLVNAARKVTDPVKVWEGVAEVLPHDAPPEGWEATMGFSVMGVGQYQLVPDEPGCLFQVQTFPDAGQIDLAFEPDSPQNSGVFGVGELREAEEGSFVLQGREVRCLRFLGGLPGAQGGAGVRLDLSGGSSAPHAYVQILCARASEKLTDEQIQELFLPFDVWRGR